MLILGLTSPEGEKTYIAAAFPSACGKTNLAMLTPTIPGWKAETIGDDIAWMKFGEDGRLYAINPGSRFFRCSTRARQWTPTRTPCTHLHPIQFSQTQHSQKIPMSGGKRRAKRNLPETLTSWLGEEWHPGDEKTAAHPNARYTTPAAQCPIIDPNWENPNGVPISAILFGGRRATTVPLAFEAFNWQHGTFIGSIASSERTAAAAGTVGELRRDPMAMLPFCGYNMGDYFAHWLEMGKNTDASKLPKIFYVNWFRKDADGGWLWPGFGENSRVLKWIVERVSGKGQAVETPIGYLPAPGAIDTNGLDVTDEQIAELLNVDVEEWLNEIESIREHYARFEETLPEALSDELAALEARLREKQ